MILVTGNEGMIGGRLVALLKKSGAAVKQFRPDGQQEHWRDITNPADVREALRGVDRVVHLAAILNYVGTTSEVMFRVNVEGTRTLLELARAQGNIPVVFASTQAVYEAASYQGVPLTEAAACPPVSEYARSKWQAEQVCRQFPDSCCILRFAGVYGPVMEPDNLVAGLLREAASGTISVFGAGHRPCDLVYIDDAVQAIANALGKCGTYNVGGGARLTVGKVAETIAALTAANVVYRKDKQEKPGLVLDSSRAIAELGYAPRALRDGLAEILRG